MIAFFLICFHAAGAMAAVKPDLEIIPPYLHISTFYAGQDVEVKGTIPSGRDVILELIGPEGDEEFNLKGRVGPFWMNRKKIKLRHVPSLYILLLPGDKKRDGQRTPPGVGIGKIKKGVTIIPEGEDLEDIFGKFLQLKRSDGLYSRKYNAIAYSDGPGNTREFKATIHLPASISPGKFTIEATIMHEGRREKRLAREFTVEEVGFIKEVRELAYREGLFYGILCVVIALFVGGIMGFFFKGSGAH